LGISKLLGAVVSTTLGLDEANNTYSMFISAFGNSQTSDSFQSTAWNINVLVDSINEIVSFCYLDLLFLFFVYDLTIFFISNAGPKN
jgi:hypothetical protein